MVLPRSHHQLFDQGRRGRTAELPIKEPRGQFGPLRSADRPKNVPVTRREKVVGAKPQPAGAWLAEQVSGRSHEASWWDRFRYGRRCRAGVAGRSARPSTMARWSPADNGPEVMIGSTASPCIESTHCCAVDVLAPWQASPRSIEGCSEAQGLGRSGCWVSGRKTRKEAPPPGRSWTQARPPWRLANWVTRARPMPEPGAWSAMLRPWWKG